MHYGSHVAERDTPLTSQSERGTARGTCGVAVKPEYSTPI